MLLCSLVHVGKSRTFYACMEYNMRSYVNIYTVYFKSIKRERGRWRVRENIEWG